MKHIKELLERVSGQLSGLAKGNAVVSRTISVGQRHVIPLCELAMGFGGGGGTGEGAEAGENKSAGKGAGGATGAGVKASPVAVVVVDGGEVRIESLEQ